MENVDSAEFRVPVDYKSKFFNYFITFQSRLRYLMLN